jgi:hypothetical protein
MPPGLCFDATRELWVYRKEARNIVLRRRENTDVFEDHLSWMDAEQAIDAAKRAKLWAMELQRVSNEVQLLEAQNAQVTHLRVERLRQQTLVAVPVKAEVKDENHAMDRKQSPLSFSPAEIPQAATPPVKVEETSPAPSKAPQSLFSPYLSLRDTMAVKAETRGEDDLTGRNQEKSSVGSTHLPVPHQPLV